MNEEEFGQRLEEFTDYTAELIMNTASISRELLRKVISLVEDTTLTEEQLIEKLLELQRTSK